jgi:DNA-binding transcriptional ArsR family regulator
MHRVLTQPAARHRRVSPEMAEAMARILDRLSHGPRTKVQVSTELGLSPLTVHAAMRRLKDAGLVRCTTHQQGAEWLRVREPGMRMR